MKRLIGRLQQTVALSQTGTRLAIKLRDQCNSIIGLRCQSGILGERNGEAWLAERIARQSEIVVDVGANLGDWTRMFSRHTTRPGRAILFEPNPEAAARLKNISISNPDLKITIVQKAVSDAVGTAEFFVEPNAGETSSLVKRHSKSQAKAISVPVVTLDEEMATQGIARIDMLKIDAEGHDLRVLIGARGLIGASRVGVVQFEYNAPWATAGSTLSAAFQLLQGAGYNVLLLKAGGVYRFDPDRVGEYYRYSNFVALRPDMAETVLGGMIPPDVI